MRAGELTERVELLRPERTASVSGAKTTGWASAGEWSAQIIAARGFRRDEVGEHFPDHTATFNIRSSIECGENWRLRHRGGYLYTVVAVVASRRLGMKTLTCERVNE